MKLLSTLIALLVLTSADVRAATRTAVTIYATNFVTMPATNRTVNLIPQTLWPHVGEVPVYDRVQGTTDTNGVLTVSNMMDGSYIIDILGPPDATRFWIAISNSGPAISASQAMIAAPLSVYPPGVYAWSITASDQRYAPIGASFGGNAVAPGSNVTVVTILGTNYISATIDPNTLTNGYTSAVNFSNTVWATKHIGLHVGDGSGLTNLVASVIINALGYTPLTNTSAAITTALGYIPATNSYVGIVEALTFFPATNTFAGIVAALGYTPPTNTFAGLTNALGYQPATNGTVNPNSITNGDTRAITFGNTLTETNQANLNGTVNLTGSTRDKNALLGTDNGTNAVTYGLNSNLVLSAGVVVPVINEYDVTNALKYRPATNGTSPTFAQVTNTVLYLADTNGAANAVSNVLQAQITASTNGTYLATLTNQGSITTNAYAMILRGAEAKNGVWKTPVMGINPWMQYGPTATEGNYHTIADWLYTNGLPALGWVWIEITDGWQNSTRSGGHLIPDPAKFPSGMPALLAYFHARGLKGLLYSEPSTTTSAGFPGSAGHIDQDAADFVGWGVDGVRWDNPWNYTNGVNLTKAYYTAWLALALKNAAPSNDMPISASGWWPQDDLQWAPKLAAQWQDSAGLFDLSDLGTGNFLVFWTNFMAHIDRSAMNPQLVGPGHFQVLDWMPTGYGTKVPTMYALLASPLWPAVISAPGATGWQFFTNQDFLRISQDPLGMPAVSVVSNNTGQVWLRNLNGGQYALGLLNRDTNTTYTVGATALQLGFDPAQVVALKNVWQQTNGTFSGSISNSIGPMDAVLYLLDTRVPATNSTVTVPHFTNTVAYAPSSDNAALWVTNSADANKVGLGDVLDGTYGALWLFGAYPADFQHAGIWGKTNQTVVNVPQGDGLITFRWYGSIGYEMTKDGFSTIGNRFLAASNAANSAASVITASNATFLGPVTGQSFAGDGHLLTGIGTVSNIALTATGTGLTVGGSPVTSSGTIALSTPSAILTNNTALAVQMANGLSVTGQVTANGALQLPNISTKNTLIGTDGGGTVVPYLAGTAMTISGGNVSWTATFAQITNALGYFPATNASLQALVAVALTNGDLRTLTLAGPVTITNRLTLMGAPPATLSLPSAYFASSVLGTDSGGNLVPYDAGTGISLSGGHIANTGVTSVGLSTSGTGLSISGSPVTTTGTLAINSAGFVFTNGLSTAGTVSNTFTFRGTVNISTPTVVSPSTVLGLDGGNNVVSYSGGNNINLNGGLINLNTIQYISTNALSTWPTAAPTPGTSAIVSSNGWVYILCSGPASTAWTFTNLIAHP